MKFKIKHPESDSEWIEEFATEEEAYKKYHDGICSIEEIKEFNLSDKIHESNKLKEKGLLNYLSFIWTSDVKEFIEILKNIDNLDLVDREGIDAYFFNRDEFIKKIDKLVGEKLR